MQFSGPKPEPTQNCIGPKPINLVSPCLCTPQCDEDSEMWTKRGLGQDRWASGLHQTSPQAYTSCTSNSWTTIHAFNCSCCHVVHSKRNLVYGPIGLEEVHMHVNGWPRCNENEQLLFLLLSSVLTTNYSLGSRACLRTKLIKLQHSLTSLSLIFLFLCSTIN